MYNPLLELQEYENLAEALKRAAARFRLRGRWIPRRCI